MPAPMSFDGLMAQVDRSGGPDSCWPWTGCLGTGGYGNVHYQGTFYVAHRLVYILLVGDVDKALFDLDHLCRNRACCNPGHLEPVTRQENVLRSPIALAAINSRKTHCKNGHEFTPENTYLGTGRSGRKTRVCRACINAAQKRYKKRKQSAAVADATPAR